MPKIFVLSGPDVGMSFEVETGALLGRSEECSVPLRHPSVSRQHARLELDGGAWWIVDQSSRNGVLIGEERVSRVVLGDGDEFLLGEVLLRFRLEGAPATGPAPVQATPAQPPSVVTRRSDPAHEDIAREVAARADSARSETGQDEIVLEGDWEVDATARAPTPGSAPSQPRPSVASDASSPVRTESARARAAAKLTGAGAIPRSPTSARGVLQYNRVDNRSGFLAAELGQQPWWIKAAVALLAAAVFVAIGWLAFRATVWIRQGTDGASVVEDGSVEER